MIACLECHRSQETETCFTCDCEQGRFCHDIGAGYAIETCNPPRLCSASAASHEVGARNAIDSFSTKQALEMLRGPLVTILARYMRLKLTFFQQTLKRFSERGWSRYWQFGTRYS